MNVSELFALTNWITHEIVKAKIPARYEQLATVLQSNAQPTTAKQPFEEQKEKLISSLQAVKLSQLTSEQQKFLESLGIASAVGEEGVNIIEDILYKNVFDIATSAKKLHEIFQALKAGINKSNQILAGLEGCVTLEEYDLAGEVLLRVCFTGNARIANVVDFKEWATAWFDIGRGVTMAHNESPETMRVVGATNGSVIIELVAVAGIVATVSKIVLDALKVAEKVMDLRIRAEQLRGLKLRNVQIAMQLEEEANVQKQEGVSEIKSKLIEEIGLDQDAQGDKSNALERAISKLVGFVEAGGEVDFVMPREGSEEKSEAPNYKELKNNIEEIRQLEHHLRLLECNKE